MKLTVSELSALFGVSVRTLHYYDEIGLLAPYEISEAGYRFYNEESVETLGQILFYRELEFSLKDISEIFSNPQYDKTGALKNQRELLLLKRQHLDEIIGLLEQRIGGNAMKDFNTTAADIENAKKKYADEVKEKWGKTPEYEQSQKKADKRSTGDEIRINEQANEIFKQFASKMDLPADSDEVQKLVEKWQAHITENYYDCTKQILSCLGQMYVADERFKNNIDRFGDGTAQFMSEAIAFYCK